jgi:L-aminopeptidase/D-esterase-like protein
VDGDLVFALSAGDGTTDVNAVGLMAEEPVAVAVLRAIRQADGLGFLTAFKDLVRTSGKKTDWDSSCGGRTV